MEGYTSLLIKGMFGLFGLFVAVYLVMLDKKYPETEATSPMVYGLIGGYITFVFAGPDAVGRTLQKLVEKVSNFTVGFKKDE